ncbi:Lysyl oxidase [Pseudobythopirellula maris]|uniref:Lysyl oxidase n=1 Tax=Pseudobythopirellula maris TaxID=2527991 RepID=A0A5C5ZMJ5_9BACT|nr:lysyl oxidase family protein [Pseudobythopirellula maris]TWT88207.1 Lysyl oxidase [Pseudobythopirellula maris]
MAFALRTVSFALALLLGFAGVAPAGLAPPTPLLPDLVPIADEALNYMYGGEVDLTSEPGRVLYRFDGVIANLGDGPFQIYEETTTDPLTQAVYQDVLNEEGGFERRHMATFVGYEPGPFGHLHFEPIARYDLRLVTPGGGVGPVVATQWKTSHAVVDSVAVDTSLPAAPPLPAYTNVNANPLGVSVGYADFYGRNIPAQRLDLTGVASGEYWLEVTVDPLGYALETDETNNTNRILVDLVLPQPTPLPGDYNGNGAVDAADFTVWRDALGTTGLTPFAGADGDGSGVIDQADYGVWASHFGEQPPPPAHTAPEPAATTAALLALAALALRRATAVSR